MSAVANDVPAGPAQAGRLLRALRAATSSALASVTDIAVLLILVNTAHLTVGIAAALACLAGGTVNFAVKRRWVFRGAAARGRSAARQLILYGLLVVAGGAFLAGVVVQVAIARFAMPMLAAKALAAVVVFCLWNYPVSAHVVFKKETL
jgi:putative flippase GtrA